MLVKVNVKGSRGSKRLEKAEIQYEKVLHDAVTTDTSKRTERQMR